MAAVAEAPGCRTAVLSREPMADGFDGIWKRAPHSADAYARALYADLRALDAAGCERILVETPSPDPAWRAIRDRLERAARGAADHDET